MSRKKPIDPPPAGELRIRNSTAEFLIFTRQAGEESIEVRLEDETIWLTQKLMAALFDVSVPTVNEHLKNIFGSKELDERAVIWKFRTTAADGKTYQTQHYNLDAIISVGYRIPVCAGMTAGARRHLFAAARREAAPLVTDGANIAELQDVEKAAAMKRQEKGGKDA